MRSRTVVFLAFAMAFALAPTSNAAVSVGHSAWEWGNPRPQGNPLLTVEFLGGRGYAAGEFGTVLRTDDAGATWIGLSTGVRSDLARVDVIDTDSLVVGGGCTLRRSDDAGDTFTRLPWTPRDIGCASTLASISFPSGDVGYVLTRDGTVLRSADGGRSWSRRTALPGTTATRGQAPARDILFTSATTGLAVIGAGGGGAILRTTDGGASWTPVQPSPAALNDLTDSASSTPVAALYAVGDNGTVFRSTDDGQTWEARPVAVGTAPRDLIAIDCFDANTCAASKARGDELFRTTDGGTTWTPVTPSTERVFAAAFASATRAVAVGADGVTVVSDDTGQTWTRIGDSLAGSFRALRARSTTVAFALGENGALGRTEDAGQSWGRVGIPTTAGILDVSFPSAAVGYALDGAGTLFRTENGGASWAIVDTGSSANPRAVVAFSETVILVGPRGVRRSTNGGQSFASTNDRAVRGVSGVLFAVDRAGSALFVWGSSGRASVSTNRGRSWRRVPRVPARARAAEYDWVSPRIGYALTRDGRVWQTRNAGRRWVEIATTGTAAIEDLAFSSLRAGYLALSAFGEDPASGYLLRTIDAGRTWRPQLVAPSEIGDLVAPGGRTAFALAGTDGLLVSSRTEPQDRAATLRLTPRRPPRGRRPRVRLVGRLRPPEGGERIVVSARRTNGVRWARQIVTAASNGAFTITRRISGPTIFVAQWEGDDDRRGAGSRAVVVRPR